MCFSLRRGVVVRFNEADLVLKLTKIGDQGFELLPFASGSRAICFERDAESDAILHEKAVVEQFKLLQPLISTNLKQSLIAELVASLVER